MLVETEKTSAACAEIESATDAAASLSIEVVFIIIGVKISIYKTCIRDQE